METKLKIKEKSFSAFFGQYLVFDENSHQMQQARMAGETKEFTPAILTNKVFYLRKDCGVKPGEKICFEHSDKTHKTYKSVLCTYTYRVEEYDDITVKLSLVESTIEPLNE